MPYRDTQTFTPLTDYIAPEPEPLAAPSTGETFGSAFRLENDVVNAYDLLTRPTFEDDPTWDGAKWLKDNNLWEDYRDNFVGARSQAEAESILTRIRQEEHDYQVLERSGWAGISAAIMAGVLSPTMFIPLMAGGRGLTAFARAAGLGLAAGAAQELPLLAAQETRTPGQAALGVAASTIVGGLLGGTAANLTREQLRELADGLSRDMGATMNVVAIPQPTSTGAAAVARSDAGAFANARGGIIATKFMSPVLRTVEQKVSPLGRWMMMNMSDAGLRAEKNIEGVATASLGTIENLTKVWYGGYAKAVRAIDENYLSFVYDGNVPGFAPNTRAVALGSLGSGEKSKATFRAEIARAMRQGDEHENPYVAAAAKAIRKDVYDPLLKEAQALGIIPDELELVGDPSYLFRDYNREAIERNYQRFIDKLAGHFERKLVEDFSKKAENFKKALERDEELIGDIQRAPEEIEELRDALTTQLRDVEEGAQVEHLNALEDTIASLRSMARELRGGTLAEEQQRRQFLADARDMERSAGEPLSELRGSRRDLQRRLRNLNKAQVVLEERAARKLEKVERAEELSLRTLRRMVNSVNKVLVKLERYSDEAFEKEIDRLRGRFAEVARVFDKGEERIVAAVKNETDPEMGKLLGMEALQQQRADRLSAIAEQLENVEQFNRDEVRALLEEGLNEALGKAQSIVARRGARAERLRSQAEALAPEDLASRIAAIRDKRAAKGAELNERFEKRGATYVDISNGKVDFAAQARKDAHLVAEKIRGTWVRLPAFEVMQGERGPELARLLDIPSIELEEFLENDVEKLTRRYLRTMSADVEIARKFGSVNADKYLNPQYGELFEEERAQIDAVEKQLKVEKLEALKAAGKGEGKTLNDVEVREEELAARTKEITDTYSDIRRDITTIIERLRHQRGLPQNPNGIGFRMARVAMNLNVLRMMGGVTISSIPDIARPIMKYGLVKSFRHGFIPYIRRMHQMNLSRKQLELAGGALDVLIHSRAHSMFDILDDVGRGSKFERAIETATNKMGIIAAFDYWTREMKQITGAIANVELLENVRLVVEGGGKKEVAKATEFLAAAGINGERAAKIWSEVQGGGGAKVNGVWMPDTELWKDADNVRAYRSALVREADTTIITPGVERSSWTDATMVGRMIAQFKSFALSSMTRTMLAGLQQRDMAVIHGALVSLALGALSYYTYARLAGGQIEEEMLNALNDLEGGGWEKFADEMIDRSGLLGPLAEVQNISSRIPAISPYTSFTGRSTTRRQGGSHIVNQLFGPSADLAIKSFDVITGIDDPTQSTVRSAVDIMPFSNLYLIRRLVDQIDENSGLPETRQ